MHDRNLLARRIASVLFVVCLCLGYPAFLLTGCSHGGGSHDSQAPVYFPPAADGGQASGSASSASIEDLVSSGDITSIINFVTGGSGGAAANGGDGPSVKTVAIPSSDIGLPSGGSVTIKMTVNGQEKVYTAAASADGSVYFDIPSVPSGSAVTVRMEVRDAAGVLVRRGQTSETVSGTEGSLAVTLSDKVEIPISLSFPAEASVYKVTSGSDTKYLIGLDAAYEAKLGTTVQVTGYALSGLGLWELNAGNCLAAEGVSIQLTKSSVSIGPDSGYQYGQAARLQYDAPYMSYEPYVPSSLEEFMSRGLCSISTDSFFCWPSSNEIEKFDGIRDDAGGTARALFYELPGLCYAFEMFADVNLGGTSVRWRVFNKMAVEIPIAVPISSQACVYKVTCGDDEQWFSSASSYMAPAGSSVQVAGYALASRVIYKLRDVDLLAGEGSSVQLFLDTDVTIGEDNSYSCYPVLSYSVPSSTTILTYTLNYPDDDGLLPEIENDQGLFSFTVTGFYIYGADGTRHAGVQSGTTWSWDGIADSAARLEMHADVSFGGVNVTWVTER